MGALFLLRDDGIAEAEIVRARAALGRRGFVTLRERRLDGWRMLHADPMHGGPTAFLERDEEMVAVAGTLTFDGRMGRAALIALLDHASAGRLDRGRIGGHFAALLRAGGRTRLFTDDLGAFQLYHDRDLRVFSTAFLAAAETLRRVTLDPQGVYEYAFNVAPVGDDTVLAEIRTLAPDRAADLEPRRARLRPLPCPRRAADPAAPGERVERNAALLLDLARAQVAEFGDRMHVPLSGGIDSRLALASLRAAGARPHVYVYGSPDLADVAIARAIGEAEGFAVDCIDRATLADDDPDAFAGHVADSFQRSDGLPNFGNIFDGGAAIAAQRARHAPGHLAVSGGGGEVYRDFFRLPDRPLPVAAVVSAFFSRFCPGDATARFDPHAFGARIGSKLAAAIGAGDAHDVVPRSAIEQLYPRIRCRALFGREITLEAGYGSYFLPFLDGRVIAEGAALPMADKQTGRFEAALVAALDPALARHPSTYGHSFAEPPPTRRHVDEWLSRAKPAWLRRRSYALRRLAGRGDDREHGGPIADALVARVIDPDMPIMRRYFDIGRVSGDHGLWYRVACLEYFAQRVLSGVRQSA